MAKYRFGIRGTVIVLILVAGGLATMWGAVFADLDVALMAILKCGSVAEYAMGLEVNFSTNDFLIIHVEKCLRY